MDASHLLGHMVNPSFNASYRNKFLERVKHGRKVRRISVPMKERLYQPNKVITSQPNITRRRPGNMPCWYYDKNQLRDTPSILDGVTFETERRYRKEGARFIMSCGTEMGLGHNTIATGVVYFHRFYMFHSFKSFPRYVTACCCLFLAGKVEETPKKCRDIIKTARGRLTDTQFFSFGDDPKEEVMTLERILLQTIKFDLQVEHPYTFLLKYAKSFRGDQQKLQKMVQMAWNFVNDSLSTVVCLQWEPEIIAVSLIHLASKLSKFIVSDWVGRQQHHLRWWDMFVSDVTMDILEDICHQVLDLYQTQQQTNQNESQSPPQKPPSRVESPIPLKSTTAPITTQMVMESPPAKAKPVASATIAPIVNVPPQPELNNIQSIKSLGTATSSSVTVQDTSAASGASTAAGYHLYAPHQLHTMYSSTTAPLPPHVPAYGTVGAAAPAAVPTAAVPPPLPPPPPIAPPYTAGWPHSIPPTRYPGVPTMPAVAGASVPVPSPTRPPPPPPPRPIGNYYQALPYGRPSRY